MPMRQPNGYETSGFLSITHNSGYNDYVSRDYKKAFAASKATAVEQFSYEMTSTYSSGFALSPANAILNFNSTRPNCLTSIAARRWTSRAKIIILHPGIPRHCASNTLRTQPLSLSFQNI